MTLRVRLAAVIALLAVCGALAACGDNSGSGPWQGFDPQQSGGAEPKSSDGVSSELPYTGEQVFRLFYMNGLYLVRGERWDQIVINHVATQQERDAVLARYGNIVVWIAHEAESIQTLLTDSNTGEQLQPDARGIYWYYEPGMPGIPGAWWARTRFGNVIANWMAGGSQRTDERWDRLNAELERLPPP